MSFKSFSTNDNTRQAEKDASKPKAETAASPAKAEPEKNGDAKKDS